jgi:leucine dehydrogenase
MANETHYVTGRRAGTAASGDPSVYTALGVFLSIKEMLEIRSGKSSLDDRRIALCGLGSVGMRLAAMLSGEGAHLFVADIDESRVRKAQAMFCAMSVPVSDIHSVPADVFCPCALGGALDSKTVGTLGANIVAGAANNQLSQPEIGLELCKRNILYAPDFLINAGGVINAAAEVSGHYDGGVVKAKIEAIPRLLRQIIQDARDLNIPPHVIAERLARQRVAESVNHRDAA